MKTLFALEDLPRSIFLAGPSPSKEEAKRWRQDAIMILKDLQFDGMVLIPEKRDWKPHSEYDSQVDWELEALNLATTVVFWVPREFPEFPAMTTNVEFGMLMSSGKVVMGYPEGAAKMRYMHALAKKSHIPIFKSLEETLEEAVRRTRIPFGFQSCTEKNMDGL